MDIRKATYSDIDGIVNIHCNAFKDFFLTSLGNKFLKFYYKSFIENPNGIIFCASENDTILGFAATTKICRGFNSQLLKNNFCGFCVIAIKLLFTKPLALIRLGKNMTKTSDDIKDDEDYAELYSIGVSEKAQGKGIGKHLLIATENELIANGIAKLSLTTDYYNNESAIAFYNKLGYNTLYVFTTYPNRKMYRLIKNIIK